MNKRYIHITKADRDFIAKALNVTEKTVYNAIRFDAVSYTHLTLPTKLEV